MALDLSGVAQLCNICATKALKYSQEHSRLAKGDDVTAECLEEQKCSTRLQSTLGVQEFTTKVVHMKRDSFWKFISGIPLQRNKMEPSAIPWLFALQLGAKIAVFRHTVSEFEPGKQVCPHFFILLHGLSFLFAGLDPPCQKNGGDTPASPTAGPKSPVHPPR
jgi:hypothetical protein